jgi:hypothetical protein
MSEQPARPPHNVVVEAWDAEDKRWRRVRAVWGSRDAGVIPHWDSEDGVISWSTNKFDKWREVAP